MGFMLMLSCIVWSFLMVFFCTVHTWALCLPPNQWLWNLYFTTSPTKLLVLNTLFFVTIRVVSGNLLRIYIQETLLISKKFIVFFTSKSDIIWTFTFFFISFISLSCERVSPSYSSTTRLIFWSVLIISFFILMYSLIFDSHF